MGGAVVKLNAIELAAEVVTSFVSNNSVPRGELPALIETVYAAVRRLTVAAAAIDPPTPAVSIRKSVTPDYLICLEDGKRFKSLRRHLATLGMTPDQYRAKWSLPPTYPMVAPNYAAQRSDLAKKLGLGQLRGKSLVAVSVELVESEIVPEPGAIEAVMSEPGSVGESEIVVAPATGVSAIDGVARDQTSVGDSEAKAPAPRSVAKSKPKAKKKTVASPTVHAAERKRARSRKATA
jgi:MucR family transcriptional regulator, transcriptional regulator of exopolysaccharide biosynthesis